MQSEFMHKLWFSYVVKIYEVLYIRVYQSYGRFSMEMG